MAGQTDGCGAPAGGVPIKDAGSQAIIQARVTRAVAPAHSANARQQNTAGDFVAQLPLREDGGFRFFAAPGEWTLRVLAPGGIRAEHVVTAAIGQIRELEVAV